MKYSFLLFITCSLIIFNNLIPLFLSSDENEPTKRFDNLMYQLQVKRIRKEKTVRCENAIMETVEQLEKLGTIPQIKEKQDWIDRGDEITQPEKSMTILEPNKVNGKIYYNPKEEYDISRTNSPIPEETEYTDRDLLLALFKDCKAEREVVDVLPNGEKGAEYVESENKLYMCRGLKSDYLLKTIIQEFARMEMQDIENSEMKEFKTYCISYMICKKYGLETSQFDFSNLPNELANKEKGKDIRVELDDIRKNFITVNSKIADYFEQEEKSRKNKEKER